MPALFCTRRWHLLLHSLPFRVGAWGGRELPEEAHTAKYNFMQMSLSQCLWLSRQDFRVSLFSDIPIQNDWVFFNFFLICRLFDHEIFCWLWPRTEVCLLTVFFLTLSSYVMVKEPHKYYNKLQMRVIKTVTEDIYALASDFTVKDHWLPWTVSLCWSDFVVMQQATNYLFIWHMTVITTHTIRWLWKKEHLSCIMYLWLLGGQAPSLRADWRTVLISNQVDGWRENSFIFISIARVPRHTFQLCFHWFSLCGSYQDCSVTL